MNLLDFQNAVKRQLSNPPRQRSLGHTFLKSLGTPIYKRCLKLAKKHKMSVQQVAFNLTFKPPLCATCQTNHTKRKSSAKAGFYKYCSPTCAQLDPKVRSKFESTMTKRHGVAYTAQSPKLVKKMLATTAKRHGSVKASYAKRVAKSRKTKLRKYGVINNSQDRKAYEKMMYNVKPITVGGKEFRLRGYEPAAVRWLHTDRGVPANHIKTTAAEGVPTLQYEYKGKPHVYHPDILLKSKGRWGLVEVKSSYTSGLLKDNGYWEILQAKAKAVARSGYPFKVILVLGKDKAERQQRQIICVLSDVQHKTRDQARKEVEVHRRKLGLLHVHKLDDLRTKSCGSQ